MLNGILTQLQNMVLFVQDKDGFGILFMVLSMLLSALLSSFLFRDSEKLVIKIVAAYAIVLATVFILSLGAVALVFQIQPQHDSFWNLFFKIAKVNGKDYLLPLLASFAAGIVVSRLAARERTAKVVSCIVLGCAALLSGFIFLFDAFQLVQRPNYNVPTEAVASVVNSRLNVYPMALSRADLEEIEERNRPKPKPAASPGDTGDAEEGQETNTPQPANFAEYVWAAISTEGAERKAYLSRAYELYSAGRHDDDYFYIGAMWTMLAQTEWFYETYEQGRAGCWYNSIAAYKECEERGNISQVLYTNMVIVYDALQDMENIRLYLGKALQLDGDGSDAQLIYKNYVYKWIGAEGLDLLMGDAGRIMDYSISRESKIPISMCVLYGACAADRNENVNEAYQYLTQADTQYEGKDVMVKILRCICADILGSDGTGILPDIYELEDQAGGLNSVEELYLIRYLHAAGKYDQLWGYIADVGAAMSDSQEDTSNGPDNTDAQGDTDTEDGSGDTDMSDDSSDTNASESTSASDDTDNSNVSNESEDTEELDDADIEKAAIKAEWYFKNRSREEYNAENVRKLYNLISNRLQRGELGEKDEKILQLSKLLLGSCLGIAEASDAKVVDAGEIEEVSDIAYVFLAVNAFNEEEYKDAISYCDKFFDAERNLKEKSTVPASGFSLKELEAQEQVVLHYHMQLVQGHSYFEYARTAKRGSEEWEANLEKAYEICKEFEDSSKSLFLIREQFDILKGSIRSENGEISADDEVIIEQEKEQKDM